MFPGQLSSSVHAIIVILSFMSVRHLGPENCKPSEILSRPATKKVAKLRKDYTRFGKGAMLCVALKLCG